MTGRVHRPRRSGRRPGAADTRGTILEAARDEFSSRGFEATTVRQIAAAAAVDPALVHHYFGTKENLFREAVSLPFDPDAIVPRVLGGGPDAVPERLVRTFLGVWSGPVTGPAIAGVVRTAVTHPRTGRLVRDFFATQIVGHVVKGLGERVDPLEAPLRVSLVASQMFGLGVTRYILQLEPLASLDDEAVVEAVAPTVRRYLFGNLSGDGGSHDRGRQ